MAPRLLGGRLCKLAQLQKKQQNYMLETSPYLHNLPKANEAAQGVRVIVISVWERQKDH